MRVTVFDIGVVYYEFSCAKIGVGLNVDRMRLSANVIGRLAIGFNAETVLVGERMGFGDRVAVIRLTVALCAEIFVAYHILIIQGASVVRGLISKRTRA
jgi:hypothetical protein